MPISTISPDETDATARLDWPFSGPVTVLIVAALSALSFGMGRKSAEPPKYVVDSTEKCSKFCAWTDEQGIRIDGECRCGGVL